MKPIIVVRLSTAIQPVPKESNGDSLDECDNHRLVEQPALWQEKRSIHSRCQGETEREEPPAFFHTVWRLTPRQLSPNSTLAMGSSRVRRGLDCPIYVDGVTISLLLCILTCTVSDAVGLVGMD